MKLKIISPGDSINKSYLLQPPLRSELELFCSGLTVLLDHNRSANREEHQKNHISDFLKDVWYRSSNLINTSGDIDLAIYAGLHATTPVSVIIETKSSTNSAEMISRERPNAKALHEIILYYLREVFEKENYGITHLIITNSGEWFIFDGVWFERNVRRNVALVKAYKSFKSQGHDNRHFYESVARPWLENVQEPLPCCWFDLRDFNIEPDNKALIALYKLLSPRHLLKLPYSNDSNSLNREFYGELLHIVGLEEIKEKGKKLISRVALQRRNEGALLENTINLLKVQQSLERIKNLSDYGSDEEEQYFSVALELCITWLNRILFLKLLEGRLLAWNSADLNYSFLHREKIKDFDELQELFFEVLARQEHERTADSTAKFGAVPYLNSSLFEITPLEKNAVQISSLKQRLTMPLYAATVLKNDAAKKRSGESNTLFYLFEFLDAYDFASEGTTLVKEAPKTIINASVLGLIFEKINGYRDGSFYTPGYITMYMSREAIRRMVLQKFREEWPVIVGWDDLCEKLDYSDSTARRRANEIINSLKICDPAVGSGHFLVSALNEIISLKAELKILEHQDGKRLKGVEIVVENDELIVVMEGESFSYNRKNQESQRLQETLFREKATVIENCLFGVDINPKSVAICRLRLWIELLKNAYYREKSTPNPPNPPNQGGIGSLAGFAPFPDKGRAGEGLQLETLPNIDINIKCGNSLVSRFSLNDDKSGLSHYAPVERKRLKELTRRYKEKVWLYKLGEKGPSNKGILRREIEAIKEEWRAFSLPSDFYMKELLNVKNELTQAVFAFDEVGHQKREKLHSRAAELEEKIAARQQTVYSNAFEWRFEFPEVLDEEGSFVGFDVVIGNPPYGVSLPKELKDHYVTFALRGESYVLFVERALEILQCRGEFSFIIPDTYLNLSFTAALREHLLRQSKLRELVLLPSQVFEDASVDTTLLFLQKMEHTKTYHESLVTIKSFDKQVRQISLETPDDVRVISTALWSKSGTFNAQSNLAEVTLLERIAGTYKVVSAIAELFYGIKAYQVGKGKPPQTAIIRDSKPFTSTVQVDEKFLPFYDGKHIGRYELTWNRNNWLHYGPWLAEPRKPEKFIGEKILIRKIVAETLIATYIPETSYCNTLLYVVKITEESGYSYRFLLGVLNSRFIGWYFRKKFQISASDTFPQIMIGDIQQLPIPTATPQQQAPIIELVNQILAAKKADPKADTTELERSIDAHVYRLYGLDEEEQVLVEG
ncbi:MAG TPA: N-6 DNA methylase [Desulfuromonadales bacterium]|nr:N-6 DNA methylase [Desulfuromonadales bacterium]